MKYQKIEKAVFFNRPNRFIAEVELHGAIEKVHVKNTGRCRELLTPGATVILEQAKNPDRKTKYSLIAVYKGDLLINMDSQVPNEVVFEAIKAGKVPEIGPVSFVKREVSFLNSRFDIYYEAEESKGFLEVKGVTLEDNGIALFPDAPTLRGKRHLEELVKAKEAGYETGVLFLIQMRGPGVFQPNRKTDPGFGSALDLAQKSGVSLLAYDCVVKEGSIEIGRSVPIKL